MFWKKKAAGSSNLPEPQSLPESVKEFLLSQSNIDPNAIPFLKYLSRNQDIRIFDPADAAARHIDVKNYNTLDKNPDLIIAEGQYDQTAKKAALTIKKPLPAVELLTAAEILQQIEGLTVPGASAFFYMSAGPAVGGPLGRGCAILRVNDQTGKKKMKRYTVYGANCIDMKPVKEEMKTFESDSARDVAKWLAESQKQRFI